MRPERIIHQPIPHGEKRKVRDVLHQMSAKHIDAIESNDKIDACCRQAKNHDVQLFKTDPNLKDANLMVLICQCGKRHFRFAVGPGTAE